MLLSAFYSILIRFERAEITAIAWYSNALYCKILKLSGYFIIIYYFSHERVLEELSLLKMILLYRVIQIYHITDPMKSRSLFQMSCWELACKASLAAFFLFVIWDNVFPFVPILRIFHDMSSWTTINSTIGFSCAFYGPPIKKPPSSFTQGILKIF